MSKCGCNSGNCSDCKKIAAKNANCHDCDPGYTGNILFDGTEFACANDSTLDTETDDNLNDIIARILAKLCTQSTPTIYSNALVAQNFGVSFAAIAGLSATILEDGVYSVHAVLNYAHGLSAGFPIIFCQGDMTLLADAAEISSGIRKTLASQMNAAGAVPNNGLVANILYVGSFTKDQVITLGVRSVLSNFFTSIGAQIIVKRELSYVLQP